MKAEIKRNKMKKQIIESREYNISYKRSCPIKKDGIWRIKRHDGEIVGAFETKKLAIKAIATGPWFL
jgi:hypothetical protein